METKRKGGPNGNPNGAPGTKTHAPYPPGFRAEAVQLVRAEGASLRRVANDLGVHEETLRLWVRQADVDGGRRDGRDGLTTTEREQLTQLQH